MCCCLSCCARNASRSLPSCSLPPRPSPLPLPQVCKLVQSQQLLSNQLEELCHQIGQVQHASKARREAGVQQWERVALALGGVALGACTALLILRGGRS